MKKNIWVKFFQIIFEKYKKKLWNKFVKLNEPDEFVSSSNSFNQLEQFNSNLEQDKRTCRLKQGLWYPLDPTAYYGYWGFRPYKGLWGHINPWWYYPYPTPMGYQTRFLCIKITIKLEYKLKNIFILTIYILI